MSENISTAFVQQYLTNIQMLLAQRGSKLRGAVDIQSCVGESMMLAEQFGSVNPVWNQGRHTDTPYQDVPQDRRWLQPQDADYGALIDKQDTLRMLIDPTSPYVTAGVQAMGRAMDDAIIGGIFQSNLTGKSGTTATGLLSAYGSGSQLIAATVGASGNTGMNIAKLREAKKILLKAEVDLDNEMAFVAMSAEQHDDLLNEAQAISLDYNTRPVLVDGKISSFMGFNFIITERIPGAAGFNTIYPGNSTVTGYTAGTTWLCPFWVKSGVRLGIWNDIQASIDRLPQKRNTTQVYVTGTFGGTRMEEKKCGIITCY